MTCKKTKQLFVLEKISNAVLCRNMAFVNGSNFRAHNLH
jgi:hypothetical protein